MTRVAKRPLDPVAVRAANDGIYQRHRNDPRPNPLYDAEGKRKPLHPSDPSQAALRGEWMGLYEQNGGAVEDSKTQPRTPPGSVVEPCEGPPVPPPPPPPVEPEPTIKVRWSKHEVLPDHNSTWPPASAPTDTVPDAAKVEMIVDVTDVPDGTPASIAVAHCVTGAQVADGLITGLEVRGGKVVDPATGERPVWIFTARHDPWSIWDKPFFFFRAVVHHKGLSDETPRTTDPQGAKDCCRVLYWTVTFPDSGSGLSGVLPEANAIRAALHKPGQKSHCKVEHRHGHTAAANLGSILRNTYAFHVGSHGNLVEKATNRPSWYYQDIDRNPPDFSHTGADGRLPGPASNWRSTVTVTVHSPPTVLLDGSPRGETGSWECDQFGNTEAVSAANYPSVPKNLFYASCCVAGFEGSFANALVARGCRNVIAFRMFVPDDDAAAMGRRFFEKWMAQKLDPAKIPDVFLAVGTDYQDTMQPVLFGAGGGGSPEKSKAEKAVEKVMKGLKKLGKLLGA